MQMDRLDLRILDELQRDGALSDVELARRVGLSPSPCLAVFISISLKTQSKAALAEFEAHIDCCDEVMECYLMTGDSDYLLRVTVADIQALGRFTLERLSP